MPYKIGSFNVRNLSLGAGAKRDLDMMASIIREFDIVALQEVLSEGKILQGISLNDISGQARAYEYSLKSRLGSNWDMCWLDPQTSSKWYPYLGDDSRGEGYAFLWRTDKFRCPVNAYGKEIRPRIYRQYRTDASQGELKLIRDPGYGRFQLVGMPNAEIRLITTHIVYKKPSEENLSKVVNHGAYVMRQREFVVLGRSIYTSVSDDHNDINCVVPYTIILGDYNLNLADSFAGSPYVPAVMVLDSNKNIMRLSLSRLDDFAGQSCYVIHTAQSDLSTVNMDADNYSSNYDHFTFDERTRQSIVKGEPHRLNAVEQAGGFKAYKEKISDHIPIMLEIDLR